MSLLLALLAFSTLAVRAAPVASDNWVYTGCYSPILTTSISGPNDTLTMTIDSCLDLCFRDGINGIPYQYGGVRSGDKCVCGNTLQPGSVAVDPALCAIPCPGNSAEVCGGSGTATSLYELRPGVKAVPSVPSVVRSFQSEGCWTDSPGARALRTYVPAAITIALSDCVGACSARGFALAGMEYSHECYCGNALLGNNTRTSAAACNMACEGNPTQVCGGSNAISLYKALGTNYTSGPASIPFTYKDWRYSVCARDNAGRIVPNRLDLNPDTMTVNTCLDACAAAGYVVGALQYGQECWCGSKRLPAHTVSEPSLCNLGCSANANQFCGGSLVNQVYYLPNA